MKTQHYITKFFKNEQSSKDNNEQQEESGITHTHWFLIKFNTLRR
jgi:hypothetical protein